VTQVVQAMSGAAGRGLLIPVTSLPAEDVITVRLRVTLLAPYPFPDGTHGFDCPMLSVGLPGADGSIDTADGSMGIGSRCTVVL
jgi:hypothetical protein